MKKKILIVDDEPNIVMSLEYTFKKQDFEVFIARDGSEALEILKHHIPRCSFVRYYDAKCRWLSNIKTY